MKIEKDLEQFCAEAKKLGAEDAVVIAPKDVVTAEWVRLKCQFGCGGYGQHLTCPPYSPSPETTRKMLDSYQYGILIHSSDWRDNGGIREIIPKLERHIFLSGYYKAFGMAAGPCNLCAECDFEGGCQHPQEARPAMEACGIDVFATARKHGFKIEVVTSPEQRQDYFGLVLVE